MDYLYDLGAVDKDVLNKLRNLNANIYNNIAQLKQMGLTGGLSTAIDALNNAREAFARAVTAERVTIAKEKAEARYITEVKTWQYGSPPAGFILPAGDKIERRNVGTRSEAWRVVTTKASFLPMLKTKIAEFLGEEETGSIM